MAIGVVIQLVFTIVGWQRVTCETNSSVNNEVVCRPHVLSQCESLLYQTALPNLRGQTIPSEIEEEFLQFEMLFHYNCSNALLVLLCGIYAPFCGSNSPNITPVVLKPCRNICTHVYNGCVSVLNEFQLQVLTCENFPVSNEEVCFGPPNPLAIPYPTLVSANGTIPLPTIITEATFMPTEAPTSLGNETAIVPTETPTSEDNEIITLPTEVASKSASINCMPQLKLRKFILSCILPILLILRLL